MAVLQLGLRTAGAKLRKPTMIEELPAQDADEKAKPKDQHPPASTPRSRPGL